jgi:hypothetical protein
MSDGCGVRFTVAPLGLESSYVVYTRGFRPWLLTVAALRLGIGAGPRYKF